MTHRRLCVIVGCLNVGIVFGMLLSWWVIDVPLPSCIVLNTLVGYIMLRGKW